MATLENLTQADIKQVVKAKSLQRARSYVGRVRGAVRNDRTLRAEVGKSRMYHVEIDVLEGGIAALCSCPYDWGGYCKHIGALLLKWTEQPGSFVVEATTDADSNDIIETFSVAAPKTAVPRETPHWFKYTHAQRKQNDDENLRIWLTEYKVKDLRQIAKQNGWLLKGTRKADLIQQIMSQMLQPGIVLKSLLSLDTEHRQVMDAMSLLYPGIRFQTKHVSSLAKRWGALTQYKNADTYISRLCDVGLAIPSDFDHRFWYNIAFIPYSIKRMLPPLLADRIAATTLSDDADSGVMLGQSRPFLRRVQHILLLLEKSQPPLRPPMLRPRLEKFHEFLREWDYVPEEVRDAQNENKLNTHDPKFSLTVPPPQPALPDETVLRLAPIAGDEIQLNFIYHLLVQAGILQTGSPVTVWPEGKRLFLRRDKAGQWAILARAYFELVTWSEIWLMLAKQPSLQLKRAKNQYYGPMPPSVMYEMLAAFRGQVLQTLAQLPDDSWFSLRDITDLLHAFWPSFDSWAWADTNYYGDTRPDWSLTENGRPLDLTNSKADWHKSVGAFIQQIIQGPLKWLGMADVSVEYGRLTAFRLHGLHDLFLDKVESVPLDRTAVSVSSTQAVAQTKTAEPTLPTDAITIEEITIIVDPAAVSAQAHNYLDSIAVLEETRTDRFVYQLSAAAIHQACEDGQTFNEILDGWEKWLAISMPHTIHDQLTAWLEAYGQVRLYEEVTVIELSDDYALSELKAATSLKQHLIAEISPTLVIIPANRVNLLITELEKAGYTPKQTDRV